MAFLLPECGRPGRESDTEQFGSASLGGFQLTLSGLAGPESAGLLMAEKRGYFADEGLEVSILSPARPARPVNYVVTEIDDLGVSHQPEVVLAKEKGLPVIAFGSLISQPTAAMIWLKRSKINGIADLKGRTIGVPGVPFQEDFLESLLARAGLTLGDVTVKDVGYDLVSRLVEGRVDAIFGGTWNVEGLELEARGLHPVILGARELGIPPYEEQVLIARTDRVAREPRAIRAFLSALRRGTAAAAEDLEEAAELIAHSVQSTSKVSQGEREAEVKATLPLLSGAHFMSPARANDLVEWMHEQGMIRKEPAASELLTNRYLPEPEGVERFVAPLNRLARQLRRRLVLELRRLDLEKPTGSERLADDNSLK
jgi:putative hydroxymethylpyrimidine transport system substrate-binding protein